MELVILLGIARVSVMYNEGEVDGQDLLELYSNFSTQRFKPFHGPV